MGKFLKGFLYFIAGCAIVGVIIAYMVGSIPVFSYMGRTFLIAVSNNQYQQAYSLLSPEFQARNDLATFTNNVKRSGLDQYKIATWGKEIVSPDQKSAFVIGKVVTKQDQNINVKFEFIKLQGDNWQDNGWRISNITLPQEEPITQQGPPPQ